MFVASSAILVRDGERSAKSQKFQVIVQGSVEFIETLPSKWSVLAASVEPEGHAREHCAIDWTTERELEPDVMLATGPSNLVEAAQLSQEESDEGFVGKLRDGQRIACGKAVTYQLICFRYEAGVQIYLESIEALSLTASYCRNERLLVLGLSVDHGQRGD